VGCKPHIGNLDLCRNYLFRCIYKFIGKEFVVWLSRQIIKWMSRTGDIRCCEERDKINKYIFSSLWTGANIVIPRWRSLGGQRNWIYFGTPCHRNVLIQAFINFPKIKKRGIHLETFHRGCHGVTQLQHQSLVRISFSGCSKSRQSLVCSTFSFNNDRHLSKTEDGYGK
jgi:hypothetical protein